MSRLTRAGTLPNPFRETEFSDANGDKDREKNIFSVRLTTSRIGNLTRLNLSLAKCFSGWQPMR